MSDKELKLDAQTMAFRCPNDLHRRARVMAGALGISRQQMLEEALSIWVTRSTERAKSAIDKAGLGAEKEGGK